MAKKWMYVYAKIISNDTIDVYIDEKHHDAVLGLSGVLAITGIVGPHIHVLCDLRYEIVELRTEIIKLGRED